MLGTAAAGGVAGQHHQHGPQAFAAGGDDVVGNLVDQHHVRGQAAADQRIDGGHVRRGEGLDGGQAQRGAEVVGDAHAGTSWSVGEL